MRTTRLSGYTPDYTLAVADDCATMVHWDDALQMYVISSGAPFTGTATMAVNKNGVFGPVSGTGNGGYNRQKFVNGQIVGVADANTNPCATLANLPKYAAGAGVGVGTGGTATTTPTGNVGVGGSSVPSTGNTTPVLKTTPSETECPCTTESQPYNLYLSKQQTPGSQPVRGTIKKVVCKQSPDGTPTIPCDELNSAVTKLNSATGGTNSPSQVAMSGIARDVTSEILSRPLASALELGAAVGVALYAQRRFNLPLWATVGTGLVTALAAGKLTDSVSI